MNILFIFFFVCVMFVILCILYQFTAFFTINGELGEIFDLNLLSYKINKVRKVDRKSSGDSI